MAILKVEVGRPVTLQVKAVREVEGKFGAQFAFDADSGDTLFVSADSARRQLERIGYDETTCRNVALLFEKVQKNGKTFLNINPAPRTNGQGSGATQAGGNGAGKRVSGGGTQAQSPSPRPARPLVPLYLDCLSAAKRAVQQTLGKAATTDNVLSAAACLFIEANKSGSPLHTTEPTDFPAALEDGPDHFDF